MSFTSTNTLNEPTVEELWDHLRSGEKFALEAIYRQYITDLYSFGMSLHADETIVKDAIQDIFLDLWNYRAKLCAEVIVRQYLFKSLSNRIQRELGKNARRSRIDWLVEQDSTVNSIEEDWVQNQTTSEITGKMNAALGQLPVRQKEVIQYLFFEKLSYEETSKQLDINIRSTYTLAWKAINSLKKAIIAITLFLTCI